MDDPHGYYNLVIADKRTRFPVDDHMTRTFSNVIRLRKVFAMAATHGTIGSSQTMGYHSTP